MHAGQRLPAYAEAVWGEGCMQSGSERQGSFTFSHIRACFIGQDGRGGRGVSKAPIAREQLSGTAEQT